MATRVLLLLAVALGGAGAMRELGRRHAVGARHPRLPRAAPAAAPPRRATPGVANCTLHWIEQTIDHFSWAATPTGATTYSQRYFTYDAFWDRAGNGSIWFYAGNEADVTLYVEHTGLMWEHAASAGALLIFAEHRFYGPSLPCGDAWPQCVRYLTHEQAQADYAALALHIQSSYGVTQPVVLFGGSYGGKLAAWTRIKYPGVFAGAVAASAPVLAFQGMTPAYDSASYWAVVTRDATPAGGAAAACAANIRAGWEPLFAAFSSPAGRAQLADSLRLCSPPPADGSFDVAMFLLNAWDTLAMGSFPYASNYLTGGGDAPDLPPWPMRAACEFLATPGLAGWELLAAMGASAGVFNNATADVACYEPATGQNVWEDGIWDYQWCTQLLPEETFFTRKGGVSDMFWPFTFNNSQVAAHCAAAWGVVPRFEWIATAYGVGGPHGSLLGGSNIVFSNGAYDPWSSGGVVNATQAGAARVRGAGAAPDAALAAAEAAASAAGVTVRSTAAGITTVWIADGAHHIDLFFSNAGDTPSITAARGVELALVSAWTSAWYAARAADVGGAAAAEL